MKIPTIVSAAVLLSISPITGPASLRLRGYLAIPLLGQSQDWTRAG